MAESALAHSRSDRGGKELPITYANADKTSLSGRYNVEVIRVRTPPNSKEEEDGFFVSSADRKFLERLDKGADKRMAEVSLQQHCPFKKPDVSVTDIRLEKAREVVPFLHSRMRCGDDELVDSFAIHVKEMKDVIRIHELLENAGMLSIHVSGPSAKIVPGKGREIRITACEQYRELLKKLWGIANSKLFTKPEEIPREISSLACLYWSGKSNGNGLKR